MEELLRFILSKLVSNPDEVKVDVTEKGKDVDMVVHVAKEDVGAVIGRGGKIANSIRTVVRTSAKRENKRVNIRFE